ncbi:MAG: tetratricopeptide repeat protein [Bacteroidales bacterium]|nr:tetratricopeptide repeat protein [Bacteroidales bacterium]MCF8333598.1 tetratricopeptide repeat protein [Bacteroidales bacterium]
MKKSSFTIKGTATVIMLLLMPILFFGQNQGNNKSNSFARHWYISLNGGISQFWGDVQDQNPFEKISEDKFMGGLAIGHQFSPVFGLRGNVQYGSLYSTKYKDISPDYEMEASPLLDYSLQATVSLVNLFSDYNPDRKLDLYGFAGLGFSNWETEWRNKNTGQVLGSNGGVDASSGLFGLTTEGYIPVGAGLSYKLNDTFTLGLEQLWNGVNTDILDAQEGGFDYDIYSNTRLNLKMNVGQFGGLGKMVRNFDQVDYDVKPEVVERHGDEVKFTLSGNIPENYFSSKAAMKIRPKVVYNDEAKELEPVFLRGEKVSGDGKIITSDGGTFSKDYSYQFKEGMEDAEIKIETMAFLPKGNPVNEDATNNNIKENYKSEMLPERKLADGTIVTGQRIVFEPSKASNKAMENVNSPEYGLLAKHGYEKETIISDKATVYFKINLAYLNWRLPLNVNRNAKEDVDKLKQFLDKGWKIKNIELNAWASPEGPVDFNSKLSKDRAEKGMDILEGLFDDLGMDMEEVTIDKQSKGEDWNGFMDAVEKSNIEDKDIILNVVRSQPNLKKREQEIRNMSIVYKEVEEKILPPLRRVEMKVNSFEPKHTDEEIAQMAMDDAESLEKNELLYSATLHDDIDKKLEIYNKAKELFPECARAYNNAGHIYMMKGEYDKAKTDLQKAENIAPEHGGVLNNLGIVAAIEGDWDKAEEYFTKAREQGVNTSYYMGVLNIANGKYDKALQQMKRKDCDYNVALAQMVSGNTGKAVSTLECVPESAEKHYLMAVAGARQDNKDMAFENLVKAVKADPSYKKTAKTDKEFIEYFDMPDFKSLVK